jgi:uncharacterized DUF497 family protein
VIQYVYTRWKEFEWDEKKNLSNQADHDGISFEFASRVFDDECLLVGPNSIDPETGELRWDALGRIGGLAVYYVVHVYREYTDGKEIIHIISAREAEKNEVRRYLEQAAD